MLNPTDSFARRHIGPSASDIDDMLKVVGSPTLEALISRTVPSAIRLGKPLPPRPALGERDALLALRAVASKNKIFRSYLGLGYHGTVTPGVILRNILLNPGWYTQYTPYQAEIAQGRLEALLNFQTLIADLTALPMSNASLLDEGTAAAEAMSLAHAVSAEVDGRAFFVSQDCHPQTIAVLQTRAKPLGWKVIVGDHRTLSGNEKLFGALVSYPCTDGEVTDYSAFAEAVHRQGGLLVVSADLLSLCLLKPPGEWGADIVVGSAQRFGVPMGFGGPHAAFFSTKAEFARVMPGRIIGVSQDATGKPALRMALQTREQHIRREKATSNICTAQVLLAVMASMYAVYHGPEGLKAIALRIHRLARAFASSVKKSGLKVAHADFFDTVRIDFAKGADADGAVSRAAANGFNVRRLGTSSVSVTFDETSTAQEAAALVGFMGSTAAGTVTADGELSVSGSLRRTSAYLTHPIFNRYHSETEMLRYIRTLEGRDLSLAYGMIPLGSCTMKLNATSEMEPVTWPEFCDLHPFAPESQTVGYRELFSSLESMLKDVTGFAGISLMPNAGSQGEYAGLLVVRAFHEKRGQGHRDVCLIPQSAHGTNPASAVMAGYRVVVVKTDANGNIDLADLKARAVEHKDKLAALMVTYPSTHGVFEEGIRDVCSLIHDHGGQVYMDGANMNAQVGLCRPGDFGADVCHLNLHKTFCIPHGGGGPGMGPIGVAAHLVDFLPTHPLVKVGGAHGVGPVSAAPWGSADILVISWMYIAMMGNEGLRRATEVAILNANYVAKRLASHYPTLYAGSQGTVAHECILDTRSLKQAAGIEVEDIAKRLMDYGFHAPTVSFPVSGTLMVEPTESESKHELDRFCDAMIAIRDEIRAIEKGAMPREGNVLKHAPHTAEVVTATAWDRPYSRETAAFPTPWVKARKFWPSVSRVNNPLGDRKLVCVCPPIEEYMR